MATWLQMKADLVRVLEELIAAGSVREGQWIVVGASTSEIMGKKIGTAGAQEAAEAIFEAMHAVCERYGVFPAFQCCEHLNRALVVEREAMERYGYEEVNVVPVPEAGGSMAAYAYRHMKQPCVIETIQAHAGIDIGSTLIGMHLRRVAVPFRPSIRQIGSAPITAAFTRPKLIGGARAKYALPTMECES